MNQKQEFTQAEIETRAKENSDMYFTALDKLYFDYIGDRLLAKVFQELEESFYW